MFISLLSSFVISFYPDSPIRATVYYFLAVGLTMNTVLLCNASLGCIIQ